MRRNGVESQKSALEHALERWRPICTRIASGLAAMQHSSLRSYSAAAALDPCSAHAAVTILSSAQVAVTDILRLLAVLLAVSQEVSAAVAGR